VPAAISLFGRAAWWLPRRLSRAVPMVDVEGAALVADIVPEAGERAEIGAGR
jgi:RND superfamily putative drug exporter